MLNSLSNALVLYAELHALGFDPQIKNDRVSFAMMPPEHMIEEIKQNRDEFIELLNAIDKPDPGICTKCGSVARDRFQVHIGKVCNQCVDRLFGFLKDDR